MESHVCSLRGGGTPVYDGEITPLTTEKSYLSGTKAGNYAVFAGGRRYSVGQSNVEAYDKNLVKYSGTITPLSILRDMIAPATLNNLAFFAGGYYTGSSYQSHVDVYNEDLSRSTPDKLGRPRAPCGGIAGEYAVFIGGRNDQSGSSTSPDKYIDAYDADLTRVLSQPMSNGLSQREGVGGSVANYAITNLGIYADDELTQGQAESLNCNADNFSGTAPVGNCTLFGAVTSGASYSAKGYDEDLTVITAYAGTNNIFGSSKTSLEGWGLFLGGYFGSSQQPQNILAFDEDLVLNQSVTISEKRYQGAAVTVGDYAIYAGGEGTGYYGNDPTNKVEVITLQ